MEIYAEKVVCGVAVPRVWDRRDSEVFVASNMSTYAVVACGAPARDCGGRPHDTLKCSMNTRRPRQCVCRRAPSTWMFVDGTSGVWMMDVTARKPSSCQAEGQ